MKRLEHLDGCNAFVTGSASGIGLGICTALAERGANIMMCDIDGPGLETAAAHLRATGANIATCVADVSVKEQIEAAANATIDRFGKIHVLVNNAGVLDPSQYGNWTDTSWDWVIGVNLRSVIWGFEIFGPLLEQHGEGGHIVSTASGAGLVAGPYSTYSVTKYGVVALSEGLRDPLAARGIGVSVLCPGFIRTQILQSTRVLPARFEGPVTEWPEEGAAGEAYKKAVRGMADGGLDPLDVGRLVCDGIEGDWDYIMTDTDIEDRVDKRFAAIKAAYRRLDDRQASVNAPRTA